MVESPFSKFLGKIELSIVTVSLIGMTITIFIQVLFRSLASIDIAALQSVQYFMSSTLMWTEEIARYLMVWAIFIGASIGAKRNVHIGIEAAVSLFPKSFRRYVYLLSGVISTLFCVLICYYGYKVAGQILSRGQTSPAMELSMVWVYAAVPVGSALMALRFLQAAIHKFKTYNIGQEA